MHILLLILKIIGIILLVILGILLALILLLVFVPFCYRAEGSYYEAKPYAMVRIRYLFPLLQVFVRYREKELEGKVKVFGFTVYDIFPPEETDDEKSKKSSKAEKNSGKKSSVEPMKKSEVEEKSEEPIKSEDSDRSVTETETESERNADEVSEEKQSILEKIRIFIAALKEKIQAFQKKLQEIREKGLSIKEKITYYYNLWQEEETQRAFQKAKATLYKLWKSIRPRKGLVKLHFGTGDPGSTGQMCGYIGMLYPFVGKYVMIEPDFENKIYEGDFYLKGRITVFSFLKVAWVVLFDKDIKRLRKVLMNSDKEESYDK